MPSLLISAYFSRLKFTTMRHFQIIILSILISCFFSCKKNTEVDFIVKSNKGHFRGLSLGDSPVQVQLAEKDDSLSDKSSTMDYQLYVIPMTENKTLTLEYSFDGEKLDEIKAEIYTCDSVITNEMTAQFQKIFNKKYGNGTKEGGVWVWHDKSIKDKTVEISLSSIGLKNDKIVICILYS